MVDAITTNQASGRINAGGAALVSNLETFLTLLTAQLKNQDPLSPVDSNEFTAQLTQLAGVEQQLLTNDLLTSLLQAQQNGGLDGAANYIGKEATAAWAATEFKDGAAKFSYELGTDATTATLQVLDGSGKVVWTGPASDLGEGVHDFTWDGKTTAGGQATDGGVYSLKIVAKNGTNADGTERLVASQVLTRGRITGVELFDGQPYLTIGNSIVPLSSVIALDEMPPATADADSLFSLPSLSMPSLSSLNPLKLFS